MQAGDHVRKVVTKWGGRPHWEHDTTVVGTDEHGTWLGAPAGTLVSRPGVSFTATAAFVSVVPPDGAFVATFYAPNRSGPGDPVELYVDITTVPRWADGVVTMVDLDLDVVRGRSGRVWVDDEDEFADHRVRYDYPDEVVALATASLDRVHVAVRAGTGAFDPTLGRTWLSRLSAAAAC
ncbi:DUF402 domain-containing protein [Nocardioides iriomotensis]|uniref:DUF402 domain-containing protein n=1 Tax=Nocardioides iriomotensis TaxID=715784 RepID=A0A4Q5J0U1_9ACTN|nr:DUF402 domain-containing protein [Nocardioides iriomotensis]RYU11011.1 DUF402 domain-containing protein [Nocardioides iriomotensis]